MSTITIPKTRIEDQLFADTPCLLAARAVLKDRLRTVERWLESAAEEDPVPEKTAHQLRVATRRAAAAIRLFRDSLPAGPVRSLKRVLREVRQAAARTRRADVQRGLLAEQTQGEIAAAAGAAVEKLLAEREAADRELGRLAAGARRVVANDRRRLLRGLAGDAATRAASPRGAYVMAELAGKCLPRLIAPLVGDPASLADEDLVALHELRLRAKRARYALEIFENCLPTEVFQPAEECLVEAQSRLGDVNDWHEMAALFAGPAALPEGCECCPTGGVLEAPEINALLLAWSQTRRTSAQRDFVAWWSGPAPRAALVQLSDFLDERINPTLRRVPRLAAGPRVAANGALRVVTPPLDAAANADSHPHRIAAIDVGSNSVRMVVAETDPQSRFRVIEDVRETTRLAGGMFRTGRLSPDAMDHALEALRKMRDTAEQHHVDHVRAVGTCAIREARNASQFLRRVEREAGIRIRPISAEYEARLAFSSVANAFDLNGVRVAVCDLGGGTADVVLGDNGLIEDWHSFPVGAVRLTDQFSDATNPGVYRYREMERFIDEALIDALGEDRRAVDMIYGTGGTLTTLARISIRRGGAPHAEGRFPFAVRGYEMSLAEVSDILEWLKGMNHDERRRVPGVNERRSEIIVAGVCVVERLMKALHTERLRIHDGGIRDGLLMEMIDELHLSRPREPHHAGDVMPTVRRFAERAGYDVAHSEQVARLALRIFDQLSEVASDHAAAWTRPGAREILEAAAVLHDVGIAIHYRRHHKHSYNMITHADLAPLARRQVELIANVARYHRGNGPRAEHRGFRRLSIDDQHLVRDLVAILRIADGLDRAHDQCVQDVAIEFAGRRTRFVLTTAAGDIAENLAAARKKSRVFRDVFRSRPRFEIAANETADPGPPPVDGMAIELEAANG